MSSNYFSLTINDLRRAHFITTLKVRWFHTIQDIKIMLEEALARQDKKISARRMQLYLTSGSSSLKNTISLRDIGIVSDNHTLLLATQFAESTAFIEAVHGLPRSLEVKELVAQVSKGFKAGLAPNKTDQFDCTGGVYFFKDTPTSIVAVFKPKDEEQGMNCNYKGNTIEALRPHFQPGGGYSRELAAYLCDVHHLANVPHTTIVYCEHPILNYPTVTSSTTNATPSANTTIKKQPSAQGKSNSNSGTVQRRYYPKLGSLQEFVRASDTFEDISSSLLSCYEVQKIALFDLRILNADRNSSNILVLPKNNKNRDLYDPTRFPFMSNDENTNNSHVEETNENRRTSRSNSEWSNHTHQTHTGNGEILFEHDNIIFERDGDENFEEINRESLSSARGGVHRAEKDLYALIPIDHGYCFPSGIQIEDYDWCWLSCPQIQQPVHPTLVAYMKSISIDALAEELKQHCDLSEESLFLFKLMHHFLLKGINRGMTLYQLAMLVVRTREGEMSPLERVINVAKENAERAWEVSYGSLHYFQHHLHTGNNHSSNNSRIAVFSPANINVTANTSSNFLNTPSDFPAQSHDQLKLKLQSLTPSHGEMDCHSPLILKTDQNVDIEVDFDGMTTTASTTRSNTRDSSQSQSQSTTSSTARESLFCEEEDLEQQNCKTQTPFLSSKSDIAHQRTHESTTAITTTSSSSSIHTSKLDLGTFSPGKAIVPTFEQFGIPQSSTSIEIQESGGQLRRTQSVYGAPPSLALTSNTTTTQTTFVAPMVTRFPIVEDNVCNEHEETRSPDNVCKIFSTAFETNTPTRKSQDSLLNSTSNDHQQQQQQQSKQSKLSNLNGNTTLRRQRSVSVDEGQSNYQSKQQQQQQLQQETSNETHSPSETAAVEVQQNSALEIPPPVQFSRVVSFGAFDSPPLYDMRIFLNARSNTANHYNNTTTSNNNSNNNISNMSNNNHYESKSLSSLGKSSVSSLGNSYHSSVELSNSHFNTIQENSTNYTNNNNHHHQYNNTNSDTASALLQSFNYMASRELQHMKTLDYDGVLKREKRILRTQHDRAFQRMREKYALDALDAFLARQQKRRANSSIH